MEEELLIAKIHKTPYFNTLHVCFILSNLFLYLLRTAITYDYGYLKSRYFVLHTFFSFSYRLFHSFRFNKFIVISIRWHFTYRFPILFLYIFSLLISQVWDWKNPITCDIFLFFQYKNLKKCLKGENNKKKKTENVPVLISYSNEIKYIGKNSVFFVLFILLGCHDMDVNNPIQTRTRWKKENIYLNFYHFIVLFCRFSYFFHICFLVNCNPFRC